MGQVQRQSSEAGVVAQTCCAPAKDEQACTPIGVLQYCIGARARQTVFLLTNGVIFEHTLWEDAKELCRHVDGPAPLAAAGQHTAQERNA